MTSDSISLVSLFDAWRHRLQPVLLILAVGIWGVPGREVLAFTPFCAIHPLNPLCCPSPCPVIDSIKLGDDLEEADRIWQTVDQCRQTADQYLAIAGSFGPSGPLATELRRIPGNVSSVFATYNASVPGMLKAGDLSKPREVAEMLKASLIDPDELAVAKVTSGDDRLGRQAAATRDEAINALSTGMHGYSRLTDLAEDHRRQISTAGRSDDARSDFAVNGTARQSLVESLGGLQELLSAWAAAAASGATSGSSRSLGTLSPTLVSATSSPLAASLQAKTQQLDRLRSLRQTIDAMDKTVSSLTALHNERHATLVMKAQYPALQNTIKSDDTAVAFREADATTSATQLAQLFVDGAAAFRGVTQGLLSLDSTTWRDNQTKSQSAMNAAQSLVAAILADPQRFGVLRDASVQPLFLDEPSRTTLAQAFSSWLEDDKLEKFWRPLREDALATLAALDQRVAQVSQRYGFDVAGNAAADRERQLLSQFDDQLTQFSAFQTTPMTDMQRADATAYAAALQAAADAVRADAAAGSFVTVRWPQ